MKKSTDHYYHVLGLRVGATQEQVRQAYKVLVRKHHPDRNPGDDDAMSRFLEIKEAYEALLERKTESRILSAIEEGTLSVKQNREIQVAARKARTGGAVIVGVTAAVLLSWYLYGGLKVRSVERASLNETYEFAYQISRDAARWVDPFQKGTLRRLHLSLLGRLGTWESPEIRELLAQSEDPMLWSLGGDILALRGDGARAAAAYKRALSGQEPEMQARYAAALLSVGRRDDAWELLGRLGQGRSGVAPWAQALLALRDGQYQDAADKFGQGSDFVSTANQGQVLLMAGRAEEAQAVLRSATASALARDIPGRHFGVLYRPDPDASEFLLSLGAEPQSAIVIAALADANLARGDIDKAVLGYTRAATELSTEAWPKVRVGRAYFKVAVHARRQGDMLGARESESSAEFWFRTASEQEPDFAPAAVFRIRALLLAERVNEARRAAREARKRFPESRAIWIELSKIYWNTDMKAQAQRELEALIRRYPGDVKASLKLQEYHAALGHYARGADVLVAAAGHGESIEVWKQLADVASKRGDCVRAAPALKALVKAKVQEAESMYRMGVCAARNREYKRALHYLRRAYSVGLGDMSRLSSERALRGLWKRYPDLKRRVLEEGT